MNKCGKILLCLEKSHISCNTSGELRYLLKDQQLRAPQFERKPSRHTNYSLTKFLIIGYFFFIDSNI